MAIVEPVPAAVDFEDWLYKAGEIVLVVSWLLVHTPGNVDEHCPVGCMRCCYVLRSQQCHQKQEGEHTRAKER